MNEFFDSKKYSDEFLNRCVPLLTAQGIEKLRKATIAIAGCGGSGGAAAITLTRMGAANFKLADPGIFDPPDTNRQWAARIPNLGRAKTDAYEEELRAINPQVTITKYPEGLTDSNLTHFINGADLVIDCLDIAVDITLRAQLYEQARTRGLYSLTAPILSFGTIFFCSSPEGMPMDKVITLISGGSGGKFPDILRTLFMPQHLDIIESRMHTHKIPSVPISCMLAASILATETLLILLGKTIPGARKPVCLPKVIVVDFFRLTYFIGDITTVPLK